MDRIFRSNWAFWGSLWGFLDGLEVLPPLFDLEVEFGLVWSISNENEQSFQAKKTEFEICDELVSRFNDNKGDRSSKGSVGLDGPRPRRPKIRPFGPSFDSI